MTEATLARAKAGDGAAFGELVDPYRRELQAHCYRILGSVQDAEDVLQEALLAAWRSIGRFDGQSLRAWLYRIATNRCLNYLRGESRRPQPAGRVTHRRPQTVHRVEKHDISHPPIIRRTGRSRQKQRREFSRLVLFAR